MWVSCQLKGRFYKKIQRQLLFISILIFNVVMDMKGTRSWFFLNMCAYDLKIEDCYMLLIIIATKATSPSIWIIFWVILFQSILSKIMLSFTLKFGLSFFHNINPSLKCSLPSVFSSYKWFSFSWVYCGCLWSFLCENSLI